MYPGADNYIREVNWDVWNVVSIEMAKSPTVVDESFYAVCHQFILSELGIDLNCDLNETKCFLSIHLSSQ